MSAHRSPDVVDLLDSESDGEVDIVSSHGKGSTKRKISKVHSRNKKVKKREKKRLKHHQHKRRQRPTLLVPDSDVDEVIDIDASTDGIEISSPPARGLRRAGSVLSAEDFTSTPDLEKQTSAIVRKSEISNQVRVAELNHQFRINS